MNDLIEALKILQKYMANEEYPTQCEHDILYIKSVINRGDVTDTDMQRLQELGFIWDYSHDGFISYRYGSY